MISVQCPKCQRKATVPDNAAGRTVKCSCGEKFVVPTIADHSVDDLQLLPAAQQSAQSQADQPKQATAQEIGFSPVKTSERQMVFATCPQCGANDVYAICTNCKRFDNFIGSGTAIECSCEMPFMEKITCPHCKALIFKKDFHPDIERQSKYRINLPASGKSEHKLNSIRDLNKLFEYFNKHPFVYMAIIMPIILIWVLATNSDSRKQTSLPAGGAPSSVTQPLTAQESQKANWIKLKPLADKMVHTFERMSMGGQFTTDKWRALSYVLLLKTDPNKLEEVFSDLQTLGRHELVGAGVFKNIISGECSETDIESYSSTIITFNEDILNVKIQTAVYMTFFNVWRQFSEVADECKKRGTTVEAEAEAMLGE